MTKRPITADDLYKIVYLGDPQSCPSGRNVLFSKKTITAKHKYNTQLYSVSVESKEVRQWTSTVGGKETSAASGRWSPDGKYISFLSGREKPSSQIYLLPTNGGEAKKLTDLPEGSIGGYQWSPDGKHIAFTFRETASAFTEKAKKEREENGGATPPHEIDTIWYRLDGDGYFDNQRYKIYLLDVSTGIHTELYAACPLGSYDFSWAPDSSSLIVTHSAEIDPLGKPANVQLYRVTIKGEATMVPNQPKGDKGSPRFSPDGRQIAYLANDDDGDSWGTRNTRVFLTSLEGSKPINLSPGDEYDLGGGSTLGDTKEGGAGLFDWALDGSGLYTVLSKHGEEQLVFVSVSGGVNTLTEGNHVLVFGNLSKDGTKIPAIKCHAAAPGEVVLIELGTKTETKELTNVNKALVEELEVAIPESHWVPSTDGVKVQAWVMKPYGHDGLKKSPAILEIHGGPHAQYGWTFFHELQLLAAQGYVVVYSNPRGSKGYGEEFCMAIFRNWGEKDWQDIQAVTSWMKQQTYVDETRMGVIGGSYGGYMTNWVIGHCKDFKAAVTDRCVSNLVSMSGNSDFPLNPNGYFGGTAFGDLNDIKDLWKQSPIAFFTGVSTPTLVIHSEGDLRCNIEQSEQVFYALKMQNVPSRFVRYPVETSHGLSRTGPPDLRKHRLGEILSWWKQYL